MPAAQRRRDEDADVAKPASKKVRAETGVSRRRLATLRRFRRALGQLASKTLLLSDLALDAGYYDQSHMSAVCRAYAGRPPGALRSLATNASVRCII